MGKVLRKLGSAGKWRRRRQEWYISDTGSSWDLGLRSLRELSNQEETEKLGIRPEISGW